jgi:sec-independent protein translocase protein TatB
MLPFSIGFGELFVIVVVLLLVVGPAKLPQIARTLGSGVRMARRATRELQDAIQIEELKKPLIKPWEEVVKARDEVMETILSVKTDVAGGADGTGVAQQNDDDLNRPSEPAIELKSVDGNVSQSSVKSVKPQGEPQQTVGSTESNIPTEHGTVDG